MEKINANDQSYFSPRLFWVILSYKHIVSERIQEKIRKIAESRSPKNWTVDKTPKREFFQDLLLWKYLRFQDCIPFFQLLNELYSLYLHKFYSILKKVN